MKYPDRAISSDNLLQVVRPANPLVARLACASIRERQAPALEAGLLALADRAQGRLVLSMEAVEQITSVGINALINAQNRCAHHNAKLVLVHVNDDIAQLLTITGLDRMLLVVPHIDDAIGYFKTKLAPAKRDRHAA